MRRAILLAALLLTAAARAEDVTYRGSAEPDIASTECKPSAWTLRIDGDRASAALIPNQHGPSRMVRNTGVLHPDGSVVIGPDSGPALRIDGRITAGRFEGVGHMRHCGYRLTATRD